MVLHSRGSRSGWLAESRSIKRSGVSPFIGIADARRPGHDPLGWRANMRIIAVRGFSAMLATQRRYTEPLRAALTALLMLVALAGAAVAACVGAAVTAFAYDASWYKANGWSGEYPNGFTITTDVTIKIRGSLDPDAPKTVPCLLRTGATYHEWNKKRVTSEGLEFVSFTKIVTYELKAATTTQVVRKSDGRKAIIKFKKGDRWSFLASLAEGAFLIKFGDTVYVADQDLFKNETEVGTPSNNDQDNYDEWLKLKCANGTVGWIFVREIENALGFSKPDIIEYGTASDESQSQPMRESATSPAAKTSPGSKPTTLTNALISIPMKKEGVRYVIPVLINNAITLYFVVDSGADDVIIPADVVLTLIRTGTLNKTDFIGRKTYGLADGSTMPSTTFRIRTLKVGDKVMANVTGSVAPVQGSLLLGQSFLSHFKSWSIDNATHALLLNE
jgi:predicted aspartyl protease